ncbi:MAG TPA: M50 family metallopeptidase [Actinomycetes bacterium]|nr:M50 family metallopeptidase [Actinomycetes bacterium]
MVVLILLSVRTGSFPAVAFVLALVLSVMLHEAGHFITAKWAGMKVTEFFFGFGPRLWSFRKGETEYGAKAIPAGGYVKIVGMSNLEKDVDPADEPRTYRHQSYPRRLLVAEAGILTHFVIAFLILLLVWTVVGVPNEDKPTLEIDAISRLRTGPSPAAEAGFKVGDRVVSIDGRPVSDWRELPPYIRARPGQPITFVVDREGVQHTLVATPASVNPEGEEVGFLGVAAKPTIETVGFFTAIGKSTAQLGRLTVGSVKALGAFFSPSSLRDYGNQLTGSPAPEEENRPVSVVGIVRIADQAAERGLFDFLGILVLLNVFIAIFNLIPLLPLDGGHIAIATYERLRSRKGQAPYRADVAKLLPLTAAVVVLLVVLGLTSVWLDIVDPVNLPGE